jgi:hypothetical protein
MAVIQMKIDKEGNVTMEVSGAIGVACEALTSVFTDALGTITETQRSPEYFLDQLQEDVQVFDHGE